MKYFLIKMDQKFNTAPEIKGWFDKIKHRDICVERSHNIEKRQLLFIESNPNTVFPDVLTFPFFLVSETVRNVIHSYGPNIIFKEIILLDSKHAKTFTYYLPILKCINCLFDSTKLTGDKYSALNAVIDAGSVGDNVIFSLANSSDFNVVMRLDLVESILSRGAKGMELREIGVEWGRGARGET